MANFKVNKNNVIEGELPLHIKNAVVMEHPIQQHWFEADEYGSKSREIDNNDNVDIENVQNINVDYKVLSAIDRIRQGLIDKVKKTNKNPAPAAGQFIVMLRNEIIYIGSKDEVKKVCEEIIVSDLSLKDDDLIILYRHYLEDLFVEA